MANPIKIEMKKWKDYTQDELEWCINNEPGHSPNHLAAAQEIHRRQLEQLLKPHWSIVPNFWMTFIILILTVIMTVAAILALCH